MGLRLPSINRTAHQGCDGTLACDPGVKRCAHRQVRDTGKIGFGDYGRPERLCLEQAKLRVLPESRVAAR
jgi:hypothetical protein